MLFISFIYEHTFILVYKNSLSKEERRKEKRYKGGKVNNDNFYKFVINKKVLENKALENGKRDIMKNRL